jgi:leucyl-tRNA synthetase
METVTIAVQVGGKLRGTLEVTKDITKDELIKLAKADLKIAKYLDGKQI